jgi:hypothetical protein
MGGGWNKLRIVCNMDSGIGGVESLGSAMTV